MKCCILDSESSYVCIDFTMLCIFFVSVSTRKCRNSTSISNLGVVSDSITNLVGALGRSFFNQTRVATKVTIIIFVDLQKPVLALLSRVYAYTEWIIILGPDGNDNDTKVLCEFSKKHNILLTSNFESGDLRLAIICTIFNFRNWRLEIGNYLYYF
ncbi:Uncharacterized protein FWK35_00019818 [Aphis craccivora]|uniref:Uncharacterized protein n=1 Tax=Aphis craccivora TaxID=307492 RepID=A0A6G0Y499_APHCR|nr:Uncharacterized protein FWK35_00019818 [Aphis craccivora]